MSDQWHCKQLPNGSEPIVVCEREDLLAQIERLRAAIDCAKAVGMDWRMDWSDFDGRTLLHQMTDLDMVVSGEWTVETYRDVILGEADDDT